MPKAGSRIVVLVALLSFLFCFSVKAENSIPLVGVGGEAINQISGMAKLDKIVFFISQEQHRLYFAHASELDNALNKAAEEFLLSSVKLGGHLPEVASWEAITIGSIADVQYIFLSHEHSGADVGGNYHQVFFARIDLAPNSNRVSVGPLSTFSARLPIADLNIPAKRATNFGYEALVWMPRLNQLMVIPELSNMATFILNHRGETARKFTFQHEFRITDATNPLSGDCFVITSFCYKADPICFKSQGKSVLSVATLAYTNNGFEINKQIDVSNRHGFTTYTDNADDKIGLYNAEGVVEIADKIYMVNDNQPGNVKTVLKRIDGKKGLNLQCPEQKHEY